MRKILFIGLLIFLYALTSQAQGVYSKQNLEQASNDSLNYYFQKAHKLKRTGSFMFFGGTVACLGGLAIAAAAYSGGTESEYAAGGLLFFGGVISAAVGLPIFVTGSVRQKNVRNALINHVGASVNIVPGVMYNKTQNICPVVALRIQF